MSKHKIKKENPMLKKQGEVVERADERRSNAGPIKSGTSTARAGDRHEYSHDNRRSTRK